MLADLYSVLPAPDVLSKYVRAIVYANQTTDVNDSTKAVATGCSYLGWLVEGNTETKHDFGNLILSDDNWHFSGQIFNNNIDIFYRGQLKHILFEFKPLAAFQLFNIKGVDTLNLCQYVKDTNVETEQFCRSISEQARGLDSADIDTRINLITTALSERTLNPFVAPAYLEQCIEELDKSEGTLQIQDLAEKVNMSIRQVNRKFIEYVGISPKYYAKVLQINQAMHAMMTDNQMYLTEIAQATGFYDQAHLIHVMQEFFSKPPVEFINSDEPILFKFLARSRNH